MPSMWDFQLWNLGLLPKFFFPFNLKGQFNYDENLKFQFSHNSCESKKEGAKKE